MVFPYKVACLCHPGIKLNTVVIPNELSSKIVLAFPLTLETKVCKTQCLLHTCLVLYKQLLRSEEGHKNRGGKIVALLIFFLF